jgi:hypothetical protein
MTEKEAFEMPKGLTVEEWLAITRMSTDRIRVKLIKEGYEKETMMTIMERAELIVMLVECIMDRKMKEFQMEEERRRQEEVTRKETEEERQMKLQELELRKLQMQKEEIGHTPKSCMRGDKKAKGDGYGSSQAAMFEQRGTVMHCVAVCKNAYGPGGSFAVVPVS